MHRTLRQVYLAVCLPAAVGLFALATLQLPGVGAIAPLDVRPLVAPLLLTAAAASALALPVAYRAWFAHRQRLRHGTSRQAFLSFERTLMTIALSTLYLALVARSLALPVFHRDAVTLLALYAAYYFYPTRRRIAYEKRLFRAADR